MQLSRRAFLRLSAAGGAVVAACGGDGTNPGDPDARGGGDGGPGIDANPVCRPSESDAMGPFFEPGAPMRMMIADANEPGERLTLATRVLGPDCVTPLAGVVVDVWQCDRDGNYHTAAENYRLRGQVTTDASGMFEIYTIKPGSYVQGTGPRPAHVHYTFVRPGHRTLTTQIYFAGDPYLQPNDSCGSCGSDDAERIVPLSGDPVAGWTGSFEIKLAAA